MALWDFKTPARIEVPLADDHPLWARISNKQGVALVRKADGVWEEHPDLPQTLDANADYLYGVTTRSSIPRGRGFAVPQLNGVNLLNPEDMGFISPLRLYRGGHHYVVDDTLRTELLAAVTSEEPTGYGAYMSAAPVGSVETGDEIMASGRTAEYEQSVR